jgi:hypothetical protein
VSPPQQWKNGVMIKLHTKKGDLTDCNIGPGIILLSILEKCFCNMFLEKLKE